MENVLNQLPLEQIIAFGLGFIASQMQGDFLKNFFKNKKLEKLIRYMTSLFVCVLGGFLIHLSSFYVSGEFSTTELLANIGLMFTTSQTYYNTYFRLKK